MNILSSGSGRFRQILGNSCATLQGQAYYVEFCPFCGAKWNPEVVQHSKLRSIGEQRLAAERGEPLSERPFKRE